MKHAKTILVVSLMMIFLVSACGEAPKATVVPSVVPTDTPEPVVNTSTPIPLPTDTLEPTITASPTIEPTSESAAMEELVQKLFDEKTISSKDGKYFRLEDFIKDWAQLYSYRTWLTDLTPTNFVIQADMEWDSGSKTPNISDSGCGFVYHSSENSHLSTFIMMDGKVKTYRLFKGGLSPLNNGYVGKFKIPSDKAHLVLVVDKQWITTIVNDKQISHFQETKLQGGNLGLAIDSGTNKDFGTRCTITNIELWELSE
jgi:hypothetical protein